MKFNLLITTLLFVTFSFSQTKGTLAGSITDKEAGNAPLPFANVVIKGTSVAVTTNETGNYSISLNPGNYIVQFSFIGYENVEKTITIKTGETATLNCSLGSGNYTLKDVVVKSTTKNREKESALLLEQKKAVEIKQSIGAQEMARKGVSDVEEGLTKITGITKVVSRGLFVRGLEERYSNLLINDLQAPSNTPFTKIIPLDLFPTDIVGVLNVYKTFNPNISGDFAGATVNIETSQPKTITKFSVGFGYTTNNNGVDFLIHSDANNTQGFLGLNGKDRNLSSDFGTIPSAVKLTPSQYENAYKNNSWNVDKSSSPINNSISFLHSDKIDLKNGTINYILSLNGDNKYQIRKGVDRTFLLGSGDYDNNYIKESYSYQTTNSALFGAKYKASRFDIALTSLYIRSTDSKVQDQLGYSNNQVNEPNVLIRTNQFDESNYFNNQLTTNFKLTSNGNHTIKGGISYAKTKYDQPDRKFIVGKKVSESDINTSYGGNHLNRQSLAIQGNFYFSSLLEYNWKFIQKDNGKNNRVSIGHNLFNNNLKSSYRIFSGLRTINKDYTSPINQIDSFILEDIHNGLLTVREETNPDYKNKLSQIVNAGYLNLFLNFGDKIEINGGVRAEKSDRELKYRSPNDLLTSPYRKLIEDKVDILPSLNLKYEVTDKSNIRLSVSKTITRPVTMEFLPVTYVSPDGNTLQGNKDLKNSENINFDVKYELFPKSTELIAVGLFGKSINNPIEKIFIPSAGGSGRLITYDNSKKAILYGAEIELLIQLSRINNYLKDFSFGFNSSLMKTKVNIDFTTNPIENDRNRKLQGASEWLINSDLKYEFEFNEEMKNTMSLVYSVYGDRIFAVGSQGIDHMYEKPFHKIDFIWSSKLSKNLEAKFSIDNLINPEYRIELGAESDLKINEESLLMENYKRGTGFSLNLSYTF